MEYYGKSTLVYVKVSPSFHSASSSNGLVVMISLNPRLRAIRTPCMRAGVDRGGDAAGAHPPVHILLALAGRGVCDGGLAGAPVLLQRALRPLPQARAALGQARMPAALSPWCQAQSPAALCMHRALSRHVQA